MESARKPRFHPCAVEYPITAYGMVEAMTRITYRISNPGKPGNLPISAKDGADLDRILKNYYQMGHKVADLLIRPVVQLGTVGEPQEETTR